ncbi:hypothetical protein [Streptomyces cahuitamycinicus]|nr:hypothetical protein [Streptomyces cahuitamycinicus]
MTGLTGSALRLTVFRGEIEAIRYSGRGDDPGTADTQGKRSL